MAFSRILGQEQAVCVFTRVLTRGRLAHAYLFVGPPGVGKATFARELAKAVLCEDPQPDACDACPLGESSPPSPISKPRIVFDPAFRT